MQRKTYGNKTDNLTGEQTKLHNEGLQNDIFILH